VLIGSKPWPARTRCPIPAGTSSSGARAPP